MNIRKYAVTAVLLMLIMLTVAYADTPLLTDIPVPGEPTTSQEPVTSQEPTTSEEPVPAEPTTSQEPITSEEPTTSEEPVTSQEPITSEEPITSAEPTEEPMEAEMAARYVIKNDTYDAANKIYTAQVYLDTKDFLESGSIGIKYDATLNPTFTIDSANFVEFQRFDEPGNPFIAVQWYLKDIAYITGEIHLGTITVPNVEWDSDKEIPQGFHKHTICQLNWLTTNISQTQEFTQTDNIGDIYDICLNEEIWRPLTEEERNKIEDKTINGYYQGYDWSKDEVWVDIGFIYESSFDLEERTEGSISGTIQSYNKNNPTEVIVYKPAGPDGSAVYRRMDVNTYTEYPDGKVICGFEITDLDPGNYEIRIGKKVHLTYRIKSGIMVEEGKDVGLDLITLYCGDIHSDEKIKLDDRTVLMRYLNKKIYDDTDKESDAYKCDLNGDGRITFHDLDILKTYFNKSY